MRKTFELLVILVLLVVWAYLSKDKLGAIFYNQGCDNYDRGLYKEATESFNKSLKINPLSTITYYMLANTYMERNMQDEAIEAYKKTVQIDPNYIKAYLALSQIFRASQMYPEALQQLKLAEAVSISNQEIKKLWDDISFEYMADCLDKGVDAFLSGNKQSAYDLLNKALKIKSDFAYSYYTLAYFYFSEYNYKEAEESLNKAIEIDFQFWPAHKLLGDIYLQKGAYEKAVAEYQEALVFKYDNVDIHNDLGLALVQLERYDEAFMHLQEASKLDPGNLNIRYSIASTYRDRGMLNESVSEYKKIIPLRPDYPNIYNDLGDIYIQEGREEDALQAYRKEIEYSRQKLSSNPNDTFILNNLAYALNGAGDPNKAKEIVEKVLLLQPNYRKAHITLAKIYEKLGDSKEALATLAKANKLSGQLDFINKDIERIKKQSELSTIDATFYPTDTIYLKNGRQIKGRIKEEDAQKVILEVMVGGVTGNLAFYRNMIERIIKSNNGRNTELND